MAEVKGLTYVSELYEEIFANKKLNGDSRALEIGVGFGQATAPVLETGCKVEAVDCDENAVAVCKETYGDCPNFSVVNMKFEDFEGEKEAYDLVYSASAFHEVDREIGYTKAFEMLKSGGVFARFSNHPMRDMAKPNFSAALQKLYAIYLPITGTPRPYKEAQAKARAELALKYGFAEVSYKRFYRTRTYTTEEFLAYLATDADHLTLSEEKRSVFFNEIRKVFERYGGSITMYDTIDLQIAKKA